MSEYPGMTTLETVRKYNTSCINSGTGPEKKQLLIPLQGNLQYLDSANQMYFIFFFPVLIARLL
jgi:hypothetical protein